MTYQFPKDKLLKQKTQKEPLVLVACGSFSPVTYLHLRMFEMARDYINEQDRFELLGGYFSPVNQNYSKKGLVESHHRVSMLRLAVECSDWLMVDDWEAEQKEYQKSASVLDHFNKNLNVRIMLLAGGDLITSFSQPVWSLPDLHHILQNYGCLVIERTGTDVYGFLLSHDVLFEHRKNVFVVKQLIYNDISSTKVRLFVKRNMSIRFLVPDAIIEYIKQNKLFL